MEVTTLIEGATETDQDRARGIMPAALDLANFYQNRVWKAPNAKHVAQWSFSGCPRLIIQLRVWMQHYKGQAENSNPG